jgi:putative glycosyltransferase
MAVVVFFFSLNAVFTGLMGLYVKQILEEVKDRPRTIVQEIHSQRRYYQD